MRFAIFALLLAQPAVKTMAMKPVICRPIEEAKGKSGAELAQAIVQAADRGALIHPARTIERRTS